MQQRFVDKMIRARSGQPISFDTFCKGQAELTEIEVLMSIEYVKTRKAAELIYKAELSRLKRPLIIQRASRRMDDFDNPKIPQGEARSL